MKTFRKAARRTAMAENGGTGVRAPSGDSPELALGHCMQRRPSDRATGERYRGERERPASPPQADRHAEGECAKTPFPFGSQEA